MESIIIKEIGMCENCGKKKAKIILYAHYFSFLYGHISKQMLVCRDCVEIAKLKMLPERLRWLVK